MKELSRIALAIEPSATMAIDSMFKQMKADGLDVIGFGAGEPDFPTPDYIKEVGIQAIQNNDTKYTPSVGTVALRKAICQRLKEDCGVEYTPAEVAVSNGAKPCVYVALRALVNPGDEVILPAPYWVSYIELIRMVGGVPVVVEATEAEHFKITPEKLAAAITPKTKCMILNNPSNPTGMMYSRKELEEIAKVCVEQDIYVICDEIYYHLVYDGEEFVSLASISPEIKERTLLVNGVSKSYAMTGWRIGFVAAPAEIVDRMTKCQENFNACANALLALCTKDGLSGDPSTLYTKSILDFLIVMIFASTYGKGAIFSALPVGVLQGTVTLCAGLLSPVFSQPVIDNLSFLGSMLIFCVGVNLCFGTKFKVANMLPALVFGAVFTAAGPLLPF